MEFMTNNIDDTRTVYDGMKIVKDDSDERSGFWFIWGDYDRIFQTKQKAEKFRRDLIAFVEGYR